MMVGSSLRAVPVYGLTWLMTKLTWLRHRRRAVSSVKNSPASFFCAKSRGGVVAGVDNTLSAASTHGQQGL